MIRLLQAWWLALLYCGDRNYLVASDYCGLVDLVTVKSEYRVLLTITLRFELLKTTSSIAIVDYFSLSWSRSRQDQGFLFALFNLEGCRADAAHQLLLLDCLRA